jgi:cell division protein FtsQ
VDLPLITGVDRDSYLQDRPRWEKRLRQALELSQQYQARFPGPAYRLAEVRLSPMGLSLVDGPNGEEIHFGEPPSGAAAGALVSAPGGAPGGASGGGEGSAGGEAGGVAGSAPEATGFAEELDRLQLVRRALAQRALVAEVIRLDDRKRPGRVAVRASPSSSAQGWGAPSERSAASRPSPEKGRAR